MNSHSVLSRRDALKTIGTGAALLGLGGAAGAATPASGGQPFSLPKLEYGYGALEPHFDAATMEIHHSKHHQAYITNANNALKNAPSLQQKSAEEILRDLNSVPDAVRTTLRNNVGGHWNHTFFWQVIGPKAGGSPSGALAQAINGAFGSYEQFKTQFTSAAMGRFGSGWAWLVKKDGKLAITSTANQDTPISEGAMPIIGIDVWEHAYYLKYQNRRADFVGAFWNVVNWRKAADNFAAAR